jgi:S1-C subfamily serine protease
MPGRSGPLVIDAAKQMPVEWAGILPGDVIISIDGQPILDAISSQSGKRVSKSHIRRQNSAVKCPGNQIEGIQVGILQRNL